MFTVLRWSERDACRIPIPRLSLDWSGRIPIAVLSLACYMSLETSFTQRIPKARCGWGSSAPVFMSAFQQPCDSSLRQPSASIRNLSTRNRGALDTFEVQTTLIFCSAKTVSRRTQKRGSKNIASTQPRGSMQIGWNRGDSDMHVV
jgi:hypothetical protein